LSARETSRGAILGLCAFQRGAGAALIVDGRVVAAAEESWFSRRPDEDGFPRRAAQACLRAAGVNGADLERVVLAEKPLAQFERLLATQLAAFPKSAKSFAGTMFTWLGDRLWIKSRIADEFGLPAERIEFAPRLLCHAASAAVQCGLGANECASVLVLDDAGEWGTAALASVRGGRAELVQEVPFPHSLGLVGAALEQFLGRTPGAELGWFEGLAAGGSDRFRDTFEALVPEETDGSFRVADGPFRFHFDVERLFAPALETLFGAARRPGEPLARAGEGDDDRARRDADLAAGFLALAARRAESMARLLHTQAPKGPLLLAGCVAQTRRLVEVLGERGPFADVRVGAAPGPEGLALGAAALAAMPFAAPPPTDGAVPHTSIGLFSGDTEMPTTNAGNEAAFEALVRGATVAWLESGLELGPESLGARMLVGRIEGAHAARALLAPLLRDGAGECARLLVPSEVAERWCELGPAAAASAVARGAPRARPELMALAPSVVDADGRVHVQTVRAERQPELHRFLHRVGERTGAPLLLGATLRARGSAAALSAHDVEEALHRAGIAHRLVHRPTAAQLPQVEFAANAERD